MPTFPSVEWFDTVREIFNSDEAYQQAGGGTCDSMVGIKVGDGLFMLVFDGEDCVEARTATDDDLSEADFYLDMSEDGWREMIENIKQNGTADFEHTLNSLDLNMPDGLSQTANDDQYRQDLFFRYNQSYQYFFDASARIETEFASSAASAGD